MNRLLSTLVAVCLLAWLCPALAQQAPTPAASAPPPAKTLIVGVKVAPPFVIDDDGHYRGLAIELWQEAASDHGWKYSYRPYDLAGLLDAVKTGQVDVGLGAITATSAREQDMDFSHTITCSGLGVAVRNQGGSGWLAVVQALGSPAFLKVIGLLVLLLLVVGTLVWALEHRGNPDQFGGSRAQGMFSGFWWAMVTMTTVGYGDTAPRSVPGRILGLLWMLVALVVVSFFTASITSALTVGKLHSQITSASDLDKVRVASVADSTSGAWLKRNLDAYLHAGSLDAALRDLDAGTVDAVVYDAPLLKWKIHQDYRGRLRVLPITLERQDYAFALPTGSPLREPINTSLLQRINAPDWKGRFNKYFGKDE
ncbi:MAG TPA: transporter substrate-binding domain-containing protein [Rhodanobacteraceae bacterium]|nr:transporter substrate-binding domain-containing protein [Rhodanobacteraceae bacterium]